MQELTNYLNKFQELAKQSALSLNVNALPDNSLIIEIGNSDFDCCYKNKISSKEQANELLDLLQEENLFWQS